MADQDQRNAHALQRSGLNTTPPGLLDALQTLQAGPPGDRERLNLGLPLNSEPITEQAEAKRG
jgi:hypothetical protein